MPPDALAIALNREVSNCWVANRRVRLVRWFIVVGLLLTLLVGGLVWFNYFRGKMIAQFFANNKPPPTSVNIATAKSETIPNLLIAVGDLAAVQDFDRNPLLGEVSSQRCDLRFHPIGCRRIVVTDVRGRSDRGDAFARRLTCKLSTVLDCSRAVVNAWEHM